MEHQALTEQIIACAFKVYNTLGSGFLESVYQRALAVELTASGLSAKSEFPVSVFYMKTLVGSFFADLVVEGTVILELKAIDSLAKIHEVQLVNYLKATGIPIGLLINFGPERLSFKRKIKNLPPHTPLILDPDPSRISPYAMSSVSCKS